MPWQGGAEGRPGGALITGFDTTDSPVKIGCEVKGFDPETVMDKKAARRTSRFIHLAVAAAKEAVESSGLDIAAAYADGTPMDPLASSRMRWDRALAFTGAQLEQSPAIASFSVALISGTSRAARVPATVWASRLGEMPARNSASHT